MSSSLPPQFWRLINSVEMVSGKIAAQIPVLELMSVLQQQYHFLLFRCVINKDFAFLFFMKYDTRSFIKGEIANGIFLFISIHKQITKIIAASEPPSCLPHITLFIHIFFPKRRSCMHISVTTLFSFDIPKCCVH